MVCNNLEQIVKANVPLHLKAASTQVTLRRSCFTNLMLAEELVSGITDQDESVDVVYLDFSKLFDSDYRKKI